MVSSTALGEEKAREIIGHFFPFHASKNRALHSAIAKAVEETVKRRDSDWFHAFANAIGDTDSGYRDVMVWPRKPEEVSRAIQFVKQRESLQKPHPTITPTHQVKPPENQGDKDGTSNAR